MPQVVRDLARLRLPMPRFENRVRQNHSPAGKHDFVGLGKAGLITRLPVWSPAAAPPPRHLDQQAKLAGPMQVRFHGAVVPP